MAPQRTQRPRNRQWTPYQKHLSRHRARTIRRQNAAIAISNSTYASAKRDFPKQFQDAIKLDFRKQALRKKETTLQDLPFELLVEIARDASAPAYKQTQGERIYDIDLKFSHISRKCRQAFLEYVSRKVIFVKLCFFRRAADGPDDWGLQQDLSRIFKCRHSQGFLANAHASNEDTSLSVVRVDVEKVKDCGGSPVSEVVFPSNKKNILWLCELVENNRVPTISVQILLNLGGKRSQSLVNDVLNDLSGVLQAKSQPFAYVPGSRLPPLRRDASTNDFSMVQKLRFESPKDERLVIESKCLLLRDQRGEQGVGPANSDLLLVSMVIRNHQTLLQGYHLERRPASIMHSCMILYEHLQRGLSTYLLSMPNNERSRNHFLLSETGKYNFTLVRQCMDFSDVFQSMLANIDSVKIRRSRNLTDKILRLLESYATLELALARALLSGDLGLGHIRPQDGRGRAKTSDELIIMFKEYVNGARCTLLVIERVDDVLRGASKEQVRELPCFTSRIAEARGLYGQICAAYGSKAILLHPVPRLRQNVVT